MSEQGARVALGDQGGGGAVLRPISLSRAQLLTLAGLGVIIGGMIVVIGSRMTWTFAAGSGTTVSSPGLPPVTIGHGMYSFDGNDLGAGYLFGMGLLAALVPLGWLATGPRARVALGVVAAALAAGIVAGVLAARADAPAHTARLLKDAGVEPSEIRVENRSGMTVTVIGAALIAIAGAGGGLVGRNVPRLRMPEKPPGESTP